MVEVFKTNVCDPEHACLLVKYLHEQFFNYKANFDLEDCDRILRVQSNEEIDILSIVGLLERHGVWVEVL